MTTLLSSLVNAFRGTVGDDELDFAPTNYINGSLQDQLMSVSKLQSAESRISHNELSAGPPPLTAEYSAEPNNVVTLPKRQGSRVIYWSQIASTTQVA